MSKRPLPPGLLAQVDQVRADLHHIVAIVRAHRDTCNVADVQACPGVLGATIVAQAHPERVRTLLMFAACELAAQPAPTTVEEPR